MSASLHEYHEEMARSIVLSADDPQGGVIPLAYIGVPFLGLFGIVIIGTNHLNAAAVTIGDLSTALITWCILYFAEKRSVARAVSSLASRLMWLEKHIGYELMAELVMACESEKSGNYFNRTKLGDQVSYWQGLYHDCDKNLLDTAMAIAARDRSFGAIYGVSGARHPRTMNGWTTDFDVLDVTNAALATLVSNDEFTAEAFRAAVRHEIHAAA